MELAPAGPWAGGLAAPAGAPAAVGGDPAGGAGAGLSKLAASWRAIGLLAQPTNKGASTKARANERRARGRKTISRCL